jgi:demethylmenaquinone methyltransferase/2-methoxy-6-polyprenyl-1,4-benzoquinol methylase
MNTPEALKSINEVLPYHQQNKSSKKEQVAQMFDNISGKYDFLNHFLSLGIDKLWRKKAISILKKEKPEKILDVATGTADFAFQAIDTKAQQIVGVDISEGMLEVGRKKIKKAGLQHIIQLKYGDSENLEFSDNFFDAVIVAFGVRNFENLEAGLENMKRVLKPNGTIMILEFSKPDVFPFNLVYNIYFKYILPFFGKLVSKDHRAYSYLPESVEVFPYGKAFVQIMEKIGYKNIQCKKLTFGVSSLYIAKK